MSELKTGSTAGAGNGDNPWVTSGTGPTWQDMPGITAGGNDALSDQITDNDANNENAEQIKEKTIGETCKEAYSKLITNNEQVLNGEKTAEECEQELLDELGEISSLKDFLQENPDKLDAAMLILVKNPEILADIDDYLHDETGGRYFDLETSFDSQTQPGEKLTVGDITIANGLTNFIDKENGLREPLTISIASQIHGQCGKADLQFLTEYDPDTASDDEKKFYQSAQIQAFSTLADLAIANPEEAEKIKPRSVIDVLSEKEGCAYSFLNPEQQNFIMSKVLQGIKTGETPTRVFFQDGQFDAPMLSEEQKSQVEQALVENFFQQTGEDGRYSKFLEEHKDSIISSARPPERLTSAVMDAVKSLSAEQLAGVFSDVQKEFVGSAAYEAERAFNDIRYTSFGSESRAQAVSRYQESLKIIAALPRDKIEEYCPRITETQGDILQKVSPSLLVPCFQAEKSLSDTTMRSGSAIASQIDNLIRSGIYTKEQVSEIFDTIPTDSKFADLMDEMPRFLEYASDKFINERIGETPQDSALSTEELQRLAQIGDGDLKSVILKYAKAAKNGENADPKNVLSQAAEQLFSQKGDHRDFVEQNPKIADYIMQASDYYMGRYAKLLPGKYVAEKFGDSLDDQLKQAVEQAVNLGNGQVTQRIINEIQVGLISKEVDENWVLDSKSIAQALTMIYVSDDRPDEYSRQIVDALLIFDGKEFITPQLAKKMSGEQMTRVFPELQNTSSYVDTGIGDIQNAIYGHMIQIEYGHLEKPTQEQLEKQISAIIENGIGAASEKDICKMARLKPELMSYITENPQALSKITYTGLISITDDFKNLGGAAQYRSPELKKMILERIEDTSDPEKVAQLRKDLLEQFIANGGLTDTEKFNPDDIYAVFSSKEFFNEENFGQIQEFAKKIYELPNEENFKELAHLDMDTLKSMGLGELQMTILEAYKSNNYSPAIYRVKELADSPESLSKLVRDGKVNIGEICQRGSYETAFDLYDLGESGILDNSEASEHVKSILDYYQKQNEVTKDIIRKIALADHIVDGETVPAITDPRTVEKVKRISEAVEGIYHSSSRDLRSIAPFVLEQLATQDGDYSKELNRIINQFERGDVPAAMQRYSVMRMLGSTSESIKRVLLSDIPPSLGEIDSERFEESVKTDLIRSAMQSNSPNLRKFLEKAAIRSPKEVLGIQPGKRQAAKEFCKIAALMNNFTEVRTPGDALAYMDQFAAEAHKRHMDSVVKGPDGKWRFKEGFHQSDIIKGINMQYASGFFKEGYLCPELLGEKAYSDATHLDMDCGMSTQTLPNATIDQHISSSIANAYGNAHAIIRLDDRFHVTTNTQDARTLDQLDKIDVNRARGGGFSGITVGLGQLNVDAYIFRKTDAMDLNMYKSRLEHFIVLSGVYTPIADRLTQEIIFTPEDFEAQRQKLIDRAIIPDPNTGEYRFKTSDDLSLPEGLLDGIGADEISVTSLLSEEGFAEKTKTNEKQSAAIENAVISYIQQMDLPDYVKQRFAALNHGINPELTAVPAESLNTGSTGRNTNVPNDADFDYTWRIDEKTKAAYGQQIMHQLFSGPDSPLHGGRMDSNGLDIREMEIDIDGETVLVDISMRGKGARVEESTDMALQRQLEQIKTQDPEQYRQVIANIVAAKLLMKDAKCYKSYRKDSAQGGLGGIGIENWILNNGGSLVQAAKTFLEASTNLQGQRGSYMRFRQTYPVWDYGENLFVEDLDRGDFCEYDEMVDRNMSEQGYDKMRAVCQRICDAAGVQIETAASVD